MGCGCSKAGSIGGTRPSSGGQDIRDEYKIGRLMGSGAFGQVRECRRRSTNEAYAVKVLERRSRETGHWSNEAMFRREVQLLGLLDHPNIIRYIDFYEDRHFLYVVLERCTGGELFDQIIRAQRFDESDAAFLCKQMLEAVSYCHSIGVVHRDIKAENFLFQTEDINSELKLIDFGMSACLQNKNVLLTEVCGSPHYLSPELIRRKYSYKADMWALGVLIYLMIYGKYPFDGSGTDTIIKQVLKKEVDFEPADSPHPSETAIDFMKSLLERDVAKRPTAAQALEHPWITAADSLEDRKHRRPQFIGSDLIACVKSAQRKVTLTRRKSHSRRAESRLNFLLKKAEREWANGKACGVRVSPLNQTVGLKPEFARHDRRLNTAPSRCVNGLADLKALRYAVENVSEASGAVCASTQATQYLSQQHLSNTKTDVAATTAGASNSKPSDSPISTGEAKPIRSTSHNDEGSTTVGYVNGLVDGGASAQESDQIPAGSGIRSWVAEYDANGGFDWDAAEEQMREKEEDSEEQYERTERRAVTVSVNQREVVAAASQAAAEYYAPPTEVTTRVVAPVH